MTDSPVLYLSAAFSLVISLLLTPLVRDRFLSMNILDRPDGERKLHRRPIPRVGGIPITFSYLAAYGLLLAMPAYTTSFIQLVSFSARLLPAAAVIFVTGLLDDVFGLRPWQKLGGQLAGASLAVAMGVRIFGIAGQPLGDWLSITLTIGWLTACTNAFNLIDGLDGLAAGMGLLATLTTFVAAVMHGNDALALATLPLAGAILGFLLYNFNPASVFLGDSGSLLIGFLLGCYGVIWSQKSATFLGMMSPLMALAVPLLDTGLAIARRWLRGRPIFSADRRHIHHMLLDRGLTHRGVVLILYGVCCLYAVMSLLQSMAENRYGGAVVVAFSGLTWIGVQRLGYSEFGAAGKALFGGAVRQTVHGHIALDIHRRALQLAPTVEDYWNGLRKLGQEFGFAGIEARLSGRDYSSPPDPGEDTRCWQIRIPISQGDYILLFRSLRARPVHGVLMQIVDIVCQTGGRLAALPIRGGVPTDVHSLAGLAAHVGQSEIGNRSLPAVAASSAQTPQP